MNETPVSLLTKIVESVGGEPRPGQIEMAEKSGEAIYNNKHLLVSAGTGVGKSFAYLAAGLTTETDKPVLVVTATKALQEQLVRKDLPVISELWEKMYGTPLIYTKALGVNNFYCQYQEEETLDKTEKGKLVLTEEDEQILEWGKTTETGDKADMDFEPSPKSWKNFSVGSGECLGRAKCPKAFTCHALKAKEKYEDAHVVIANTALYAIYLSAGMNENILPDHDVVIFDECHKMPDSVRNALASKVNKFTVNRIAQIHAKHFVDSDIENDLKNEAERLEFVMAERMESGYDTDGKKKFPKTIERLKNMPQNEPEIYKNLERILELTQASHARISREMRANSTMKKFVLACEMSLKSIENFNEQLISTIAAADNSVENKVVWISKENSAFSLNVSSIDIAEFLKESLWESPVSAILCSATVPSKLDKELGLTNFEKVNAESPFNYKENSYLYIPEGMPHGNNRNDFFDATIPQIEKLINLTQGRTLLLFTSWKAMNETYAIMTQKLGPEYTLMKQGEKPKGLLVEDFMNSDNACLFGTQSFWEGVSIDGDACVSVIIDKIPFSSPNDPILQAIREKAGDKAFFEVDIPHASTTLAQGVGRLIRTINDKGIVTVLDARLAEKNYRDKILTELPPMRRVRNSEIVEEFAKSKL